MQLGLGGEYMYVSVLLSNFTCTCYSRIDLGRFTFRNIFFTENSIFDEYLNIHSPQKSIYGGQGGMVGQTNLT